MFPARIHRNELPEVTQAAIDPAQGLGLTAGLWVALKLAAKFVVVLKAFLDIKTSLNSFFPLIGHDTPLRFADPILE